MMLSAGDRLDHHIVLPVRIHVAAGYGEIDAGWGPAGTIASTFDDAGKVTGAGLGAPYKIGAGFGGGAFAGKQFTGTLASPTLGELGLGIIQSLVQLMGGDFCH